MPETWVRAAMLIRCKSLLNAHSAVRLEVVELLIAFLNHNLIPLVPLRGSISASGDLQPLGYIAGVLEGNPDLYVWTDDGKGGRDLISADAALELLKRRAIVYRPKEALGILNGTAFSAASGALALHASHRLATLAQVLTTMGVEALLGSVGSFSDFFSNVRPHPGQTEVSQNIRKFLLNSHLARSGLAEESRSEGLKQDRYAIRTSPQWIGPTLEDLTLAHTQITTECNSTTDNPLIDIPGHTIHHGGNFQALSVTSAMEKTRSTLQILGRMLFSQCTELINPDLNNGLPPNLAPDEPSTSYTLKGADVNMAAYTSELGFLANPVSNHVQTAEMGNQAINSLALISARYTHTAVDCLSMISAKYLYVLCQALDLRAMDFQFQSQIPSTVQRIAEEVFAEAFLPDHPDLLTSLSALLTSTVLGHLPKTTHLDSQDRFTHIAHLTLSPLTTFLSTHHTILPPSFSPLVSAHVFSSRLSSTLYEVFNENRTAYLAAPDATALLGTAAKKMYRFVRGELGVEMCKGLVDHPQQGNGKKTIGGNISVIHEAVKDGRINEVVVACLRDGEGVDE